MNENINIAEILKDAPKGTKLWSPMFGECEFVKILSVGICQIQVKHTEGNTYNFYNFTSQGKFSNSSEAECLLFPSKDNRDWSTFKVPQKHKNFEPFQKVLIPNIMGNAYYWFANLYSHYDKEHKVHVLIDSETINTDDRILSYKGNEDKLGKIIK